MKQGFGSFLTLEFGEPHLCVREPRKPGPGSTPKHRKHYARRLVTLRGDWHLWIYGCDWAIYDRRKQIADSEASDRRIAQAAAILDGQALEKASIHYRGGRLVVKSWPPEYEAWLLYEPDERVLTLRADKTFSHVEGSTPPDSERWRPAWSS